MPAGLPAGSIPLNSRALRNATILYILLLRNINFCCDYWHSILWMILFTVDYSLIINEPLAFVSTSHGVEIEFGLF